MKYKILIFALLYLLSFQAYSDFSHENCMKNAKGNSEMKQCSWKAYNIVNDHLEVIYTRMLKKYKELSDKNSINPYLERLQLSQSAWIVFREANCNLLATSMLGGSGEGLVWSECKLDMTEARIRELEKFENETK